MRLLIRSGDASLRLTLRIYSLFYKKDHPPLKMIIPHTYKKTEMAASSLSPALMAYLAALYEQYLSHCTLNRAAEEHCFNSVFTPLSAENLPE